MSDKDLQTNHPADAPRMGGVTEVYYYAWQSLTVHV